MAEPSSEKLLKCGLVSIVGRPNVGKSTLLNRIVGEKVAIVSRVPQTTRNQVRGIYNDERGQIVFVDTPGLHAGRDRLDQFMNKSAYSTVDDADVVIHLVDSEERVGQEEERLAQKLSRLSAPLILGLNKVDLKGRYLSEYIALWERVRGKPVTAFEKFTLLPLSGKTGLHIDKLLEIVFSCLPEGTALYPRDAVTDVPQRMAIADILREKFFELLRDEIPHSLAVIVEDMQPRGPSLLHIRALVLLERDSQKIIVIGKDGQNLKKVGTSARIELEALLSKKVFLEIFVKSKKNWRDNGSLLEEMGYVSL